MKAYAKLNLTLEILSRREDGYHEVRSILQAIDMADTITIEPSDRLFLEDAPSGIRPHDNLVLRAAVLLQEETGTSKGARLGLKKLIPVAGGLGGGSSDAAATLRGLNTLWGLGLAIPQLQTIGAKLGSDVPFFLGSGTAFISGRGEVVTPLLPPPEAWFVLTCLPLQMPDKTASLYRLLQPRMFTKGEHTQLLAADIAAGRPLHANRFANSFLGTALAAFPGLREAYYEFEKTGVREIHLSGSGPTLFTLVPGEFEGLELLKQCDRRGLPAYLVKTIAKPV